MDPRIVELLARLSEVSDDALDDLSEILVAQLEEAAEAKDVELARGLADAIDKVKAESTQRAEMARQREAEIAEIMSRVHAQSDEKVPDSDNGEGDSDDADKAPDSDSDDDSNTDSNATASAKDRPLPKIGDLVRRRQDASGSSHRPSRTPSRTEGTTTVVAASDVPGITAGTELDRLSMRKAMIERWQSTAGSRTSGRLPVARWQFNYPEDRILRSGAEEENWEKLQKAVSPQALTASGGICAPPAGFYDTVTLATAARPLRNALAVFQATRGAISFIPSLSVADVTGALGITTNAEDLAGPTKSCLTITCEDIESVQIQAIHRCLQFGNFNARTHPEYVSHISDLTLAAHARMAEEALWSQMCVASTAVTAAEELGAWRDLYGILGRAVAAFRSRHRMALDARLRVVAPGWLATMLSTDLVRQQPGDNTVGGTSRAQFENFLGTLNVSITWTLEGSEGMPQVFGAQAAGGLIGYPDAVQMLVYPEGSFLFLDGGTLDLGIVRDSTLNASNDFQTFAETFEAVAFLGPEALCLTADLCSSGLSAGTDSTVTCGS